MEQSTNSEYRLHFLGTGGSVPIPRPACDCRVCHTSHLRGGPHCRMGPGLFVEGPDLLFDTTDEIRVMLNRADIMNVGGVVYTHWHPDHTAGWRVLEMLNTAPEGGGVQSTTPVYVPRSVWEDFEQKKQVGMAANLDYLERCGLVRILIMEDECPIQIGGVQIEAISMKSAWANMYAFLLEQGGTRTLLAVDHLHGWEPPPRLSHIDVAVLETGWAERRPDGTSSRLIEEIAKTKTTLEKTLEIVRALRPKRVFLTHIQEYYGWTLDDYAELQAELADEYPNLVFAYDGLTVDL